VSVARYDAHVDWYEQFRPSLGDDERLALRGLLGSGPGRCLDIGCGTGVAIPVLEVLGWNVVGVDSSPGMLERARLRSESAELLLAEANALPFEDASFDAAVSIWTHTDVEDFDALVREAARVLEPGAPFAYIGAHPCFVGPHSRFIEAKGIPDLHDGYRREGRYDDGPAINPSGLRARVGAVHLTLEGFLGAFPAAGLPIVAFSELGEREYPYVVAVGCRRLDTLTSA
jgi:SAM-dependent methyltransferase